MLEHINWSDDEGEEEAPSDPSQAKLTYTFWSDTVAFRHKVSLVDGLASGLAD